MSTLTVVVGGSRGIGAAVSRRVALGGHDVVIGFLNDRRAAEAVAQDVAASGRRALVEQVDVTDVASVTALFAAATELGTVTGLVNSAGAVSAVGRLDENDLGAVWRDVEVNLLGVLNTCKQAIAPITAAGGGSIVNISSAAATLGSPGEYVHYAAAKAAVDTLTVGLAQELAPNWIRVNAVAPGVISTDFHRDPQRPAKMAPTIPLGRAGMPDEVAGAVAGCCRMRPATPPVPC